MKTKNAASAWLLLAGALVWSSGAASAFYGQAPSSAPAAEEVTRGEVLYRLHCASCHGKEGLGDGPVAGALVVPPPDLTRLAQRAGGEFPADAVHSAIDGRTEVRGHGTREMPVWGLSFADRGSDAPQEGEIRAEIRALVRYLESRQRR